MKSLRIKLLKELFVNRKISNKPNTIGKKIRSGRTKIYLGLAILLLCPLTIWGTTQNFKLTMMALTTFALAYISKGMRKTKSGYFFK